MPANPPAPILAGAGQHSRRPGEPEASPLELIVRYSVEQEVIPRAFTVEELFDGTADALGRT